jgi:hypothetical protein
MFGFGKAPDHFPELLEHLVENWDMRARYASAFLSEYRSSISKIHEQGLKNLERLRTDGSAEQKLIAISTEPKDYALVGQAYQAYLTDLRRGKNVNTDIELAIWAILANRVDLLESIDRGLAGFIEAKQEEKFPGLFDQVFSDRA